MSKISSILARLFSTPLKACVNNGMKVGKNCSIMSWKIVSEAYLIEIGDHVQITDGVHLFTHGGGWVLRKDYPDYDSFGKVVIGNNVYIGNNAVIMPGITVGNNVVIGACSVVTKNIPDNVVVAGNPAKIINTTDNYIQKMLPYNLHCKNMNDAKKKKYLLTVDRSKLIRITQTLSVNDEK